MARLQGGEYSHGFSYCFDCHEKYRNNSFAGLGRCPVCAAKHSARFTVYDRDKGIGTLPANLRERAQ
jgi:hypothetical protein